MGGIISLIVAATTSEVADGEPIWWFVAIPAWVVTIVCAGVGIVRFIKWAWEG